MKMYKQTHCIQHSDEVKIAGELDVQFGQEGVVSYIEKCGVQHDGLPVSQSKKRHVVPRPAQTRSPSLNIRASEAF